MALFRLLYSEGWEKICESLAAVFPPKGGRKSCSFCSFFLPSIIIQLHKYFDSPLESIAMRQGRNLRRPALCTQKYIHFGAAPTI